jgi:hypothetical protein
LIPGWSPVGKADSRKNTVQVTANLSSPVPFLIYKRRTGAPAGDDSFLRKLGSTISSRFADSPVWPVTGAFPSTTFQELGSFLGKLMASLSSGISQNVLHWLRMYKIKPYIKTLCFAASIFILDAVILNQGFVAVVLIS